MIQVLLVVSPQFKVTDGELEHEGTLMNQKLTKPCGGAGSKPHRSNPSTASGRARLLILPERFTRSDAMIQLHGVVKPSPTWRGSSRSQRSGLKINAANSFPLENLEAANPLLNMVTGIDHPSDGRVVCE